MTPKSPKKMKKKEGVSPWERKNRHSHESKPISSSWKSAKRFFHIRGTKEANEGVTGKLQKTRKMPPPKTQEGGDNISANKKGEKDISKKKGKMGWGRSGLE